MQPSLTCYDRTARYAPQWRYPPPPAGFYEQPYFVPFQVTMTGNSNPVYRIPIQLDDDHTFLARTLIFPSAGNNIQTLDNPPVTGVPLLLRFWDTRGNPLSNELALAFGVFCQSGFGVNLYGFPFPHQVTCDAGGLVQVDYQAPAIGGGTSATASATDDISGETITFTSVVVGGSATIFMQAQTGINQPLTISLVGTEITITLATNGAGAPNSTFTEVVGGMNANGPAAALVNTTLTGANPGDLIPVALFGAGGLALVPATAARVLTGYLYGVLVRKVC